MRQTIRCSQGRGGHRERARRLTPIDTKRKRNRLTVGVQGDVTRRDTALQLTTTDVNGFILRKS